MNKRHRLGRRGEQIAAGYFKANGYRILEVNYRNKLAEIDLICQRENWLIFAEVKTRTSVRFGYPEESVSPQQCQRIMDAAAAYARENDLQALFRFDIISIIWYGNAYSLSHFEDAFF